MRIKSSGKTIGLSYQLVGLLAKEGWGLQSDEGWAGIVIFNTITIETGILLFEPRTNNLTFDRVLEQKDKKVGHPEHQWHTVPDTAFWQLVLKLGLVVEDTRPPAVQLDEWQRLLPRA